jgi:hypothetical protein
MPGGFSPTSRLCHREPNGGEIDGIPQPPDELLTGKGEAEGRDKHVTSPTGGVDEEEIVTVVAANLVWPAAELGFASGVERNEAFKPSPISEEAYDLEVMELIDHSGRHAGLVSIQ